MTQFEPGVGTDTPCLPVGVAFRTAAKAETTTRGRHHLGIGLALGLGLLFVGGGYGHYVQSARAEAARAEAKALQPMVRTTVAAASDEATAVELPGSTEAFEVASIYPRASGYVAQRLADIGTRVKKGDALAVIESPELDRQLTQAQAQHAEALAVLGQAQVNERLAKITADRYAILAAKNYATQQEGDNYRLALEARQADVKIAEATVDAREADLQRLRQLAKYERVEAPFDGVITARNVDIGDLSNADSANLIASGQSLFKEADDDTLRVRFDVPQSAAIGIVDGLSAQVTVPEMPNRVFTGKIARNADSLVPGTRTLRVEVDVDNRDHVLKAGLYVHVHLDVPRGEVMVSVPSEAVIFGDHGVEVATVVDGKVRLRPIKIDQDHGATVDVVGGLSGGETLVLNPYADITDGQAVMIDDHADTPAVAKAG